MPRVIQVDRDDEISELIGKVRGVEERVVALVLPAEAAVFQTSLNVRLLGQFASREQREVSIISSDSRMQQLARSHGLHTYASVAAFERGIELTRPPDDATVTADEAKVAVPAASVDAVRAVPPAARAPRQKVTRAPAVVPVRKGASGRDRRRPLYFGLIALGVMGILLFFVLSPSAKVVVTMNAVPVSVSPTIQGTPDQAESHQPDHILTQVVSADASGQFQAVASGQKQIPPTNSSGQIVMVIANPLNPYWVAPSSQPFGAVAVPKGYRVFSTTNPQVIFQVSQDTVLTFTKSPLTPAANPQSNPLPIVSLGQGAAQNVPANRVDQFFPGQDPCGVPENHCTPGDFKIINPQATAGGIDPKTVVVVSPDNVNAWQKQVTDMTKVETDKVNADLLAMAAGKQFAADPNGGGKTIAPDVQPPLPKAGDTFPPTAVTVAVHGKASVFNPLDVRAVILKDLQQQVPTGDTLIPDKLSISQISIIQATDDGHIAMSVTATDYHFADVHLDQLKDSFAGKSPDEVRKLITHRIDRVQSVEITETPFSLFFMPFFSSRIEIDVNFVTPPTKS